jgi:hypothetical protein
MEQTLAVVFLSSLPPDYRRLQTGSRQAILLTSGGVRSALESPEKKT